MKLSSMLSHLKKETTKNIIINTGGTYLTVVFTAFYTFVLVRLLDPTNYGIFSVLFAIMYVFTNVLDFGVAASLYAHIPSLSDDKNELAAFLKTNLLFQTILAASILILASIFTPFIDRYILKLYVPDYYYYLTYISILLLIWQNFVTNALYASKKFLFANILNNLLNIGKGFGLAFLIFNDLVRIDYLIILLGIVGTSIFILVSLIRYRDIFQKSLVSTVDRAHLKISYTITYLLATQFWNLASRMDLFIMSYYLSKAEVGHYAVAQKIVLTIITAASAITQVLSPQFSLVKTKQELTALMKKSYLFMLAPTAALLAALCIPQSFFNWFFGVEYSSALFVTQALSIVYILFGITVLPTLFFLYTIKKPAYVMWANILLLITISLFNWYAVPHIGVIAAVIANAIGYTLIAIFLGISYLREIKKLPS